MLCIAHRGFSLKYRENSLESIREAVGRGYDGLEIDVQMCETGELVLAHDLYHEDKFIRDMTYDEIKKKGLCTLAEIYEKIPDIEDVLLLLDIKGNNLDIADSLRFFYKFKSVRNVIFCSFNRKILFNLPYQYKKGTTFEAVYHHSEYDMILRNFSAVMIHWTCLDHQFILECKKKNVKVYTYTHKNDLELQHMYTFNIDGIITNGF